MAPQAHGIPEPVPWYAKVLSWVIVAVFILIVGLFHPAAAVAFVVLAAIGGWMEREQKRARQESEDRIVQRIAEKIREGK